MKLALITSIKYPSRAANRIHTFAMADAFAENGFLVDFFCQSINNRNFSDNVTVLPLGGNRSILCAWKYSKLLKKNKYEFWFIREPHLMLFTIIFYMMRSLALPPLILYEVHDMPRDFLDSLSLWFLKKLKKIMIIVISSALGSDLNRLYNIKNENILVLPDGVNLNSFGPNLISTKTRIPQSSLPLVLYTGNLFSWKGVYILLEAAKRTPEINYWFVGGNENDIRQFRIAANGFLNVKILGYVQHEMVNNYLNVADVLVLPNSATYKMSVYYTSPLKLFEYMASKKPIVASNLPSIREILTNNVNAYLVMPDDASALVDGIRKALNDPKKCDIVEKAFIDVQEYTWDKRVKKIINQIKN